MPSGLGNWSHLESRHAMRPILRGFFDGILKKVDPTKINHRLTFNMDESIIAIIERRAKVVVPSDWDEAPTDSDAQKSEHITFLVCVSAECDNVHRCQSLCILPRLQNFPEELVPVGTALHWAHSECGWITTEIFGSWIDTVFLPHVTLLRHQFGPPGAPALLWLDGHHSRAHEEALELLFQNNIHAVAEPHIPHLPTSRQRCLQGVQGLCAEALLVSRRRECSCTSNSTHRSRGRC